MKLLIKWSIHLFIIYVLGIYFVEIENLFLSVLIITLLLVPISYWTDLYAMQRIGNFQSAFLEGVSLFILICVVQSLLPDDHFSFLWPLLSGLLVLVFEIILHRWIINRSASIHT